MAIPLAICAGILTGAAVGLVNGIGIAVFRVTPFVMTLGMLTAARGLADLIANGGTIVGLPRAFSLFGRSEWFGVPSAACIGGIVMVFAWVVLQRSRAGLYIYSIGGSLETARVAGVPIVALPDPRLHDLRRLGGSGRSDADLGACRCPRAASARATSCCRWPPL